MRYSLLFFADQDSGDARQRYDLLFASCRLADERGFEAVWIPERHFHSFGGAFPNPALVAGAVATMTSRLRIRAGSVVAPLHDALTVAEDWSVVDNLSGGRVDLSFAAGWNANDFVLAPARYPDRYGAMFGLIEEVDRLWAGGEVCRDNGENVPVRVRVYPRPVQPALRHWLTCTAAPERFTQAGERGLNVLTALLFQTPGELKANIDAYRAARARAGFPPGEGQVTLMLHAHLGRSVPEVHELVRPAFSRYLESSVSLWKNRWKELEALEGRGKDLLLGFAFRRYSQSAALFGTVESCQPLIADLAAAGVDEIACLVDFGLDSEQVLAGLAELARLL